MEYYINNFKNTINIYFNGFIYGIKIQSISE
jgi:hypothetical protein